MFCRLASCDLSEIQISLEKRNSQPNGILLKTSAWFSYMMPELSLKYVSINSCCVHGITTSKKKTWLFALQNSLINLVGVVHSSGQ